MHTYIHTYTHTSLHRARRDDDRDIDTRTRLTNSGARAERNIPSEKRDRQTDEFKDEFELRRETSGGGYGPVSDDAGLFIPGDDDVRTSYDDLFRAESSVCAPFLNMCFLCMCFLYMCVYVCEL